LTNFDDFLIILEKFKDRVGGYYIAVVKVTSKS